MSLPPCPPNNPQPLCNLFLPAVLTATLLGAVKPVHWKVKKKRQDGWRAVLTSVGKRRGWVKMFRYLWLCIAAVIGPEGALTPRGSERRCHNPAFVVSFSISLCPSVRRSTQARRSFYIIAAFPPPAFPHLTCLWFIAYRSSISK